MAEKDAKEEGKEDEIKPKSGYKFLSVWTVPVGKQPAVRIEVPGRLIKSQDAFELACNSLGMFRKTRKCFALFRGVANPTKKYGTDERIFLPCKGTLTIQRWCFDLVVEKSIIKTDAAAFRIIAIQIISEIENGKMKVTTEEMERLKMFYEETFVCYKQFIDEARKIPSYSSLTMKNVEVVTNAQFVNTTIEEGTKVDIVIHPKKMQLISDTIELAIPWRKIRQFAEIIERKTINLEIFLTNEKTFTWIEFRTPQRTLLLQAIAECIDMLRVKVEMPLFPQPHFVYKKKRNKLSWSLIKTEFFEIGQKKEEFFSTFDTLDISSSEDEEQDDNDCISSSDEDEEVEGSRTSVQSRYQVR